jgi:mono/diheme cytochrome c family protein
MPGAISVFDGSSIFAGVALTILNALMPALTHAQAKTAGDAAAGRALALEACTGCHIVAADQPFKPIYTGSLRPPDFKDIANKPNTTAASLRHYLATLPTVPADSRMANPDLTAVQLEDVVAFIMTLRDK